MCEIGKHVPASFPSEVGNETRAPDTPPIGTLSRRDLLKAGAGLAGGLAAGLLHALPAGAAPAIRGNPRSPEDLRVYVVAIDSLRPDEVTDRLTPNLFALREQGIWYDSVGIMPSSSTQNFAAAFTGARPQANGFAFQTVGRDSGQRFWVDHLFTRLARERADVSTSSFSNTSRFGLFNTQQDDPAPDQEPPKAGGIDADPIGAFGRWALVTSAPQFGFLHLGDPGAVAHVLPTPEPDQEPLAAARAEREASIRALDQRLGDLFTGLAEAWSQTILLVVSDHGMDFVTQDGWIPFDAHLAAAGYRGSVLDESTENPDYSQRGDADASLFVKVPPFKSVYEDEKKVDDIAGVLADIPGVALVVTRRSSPYSLADLGLDPYMNLSHVTDKLFDIVAFADENHTFFPGFFGIHGHPIAQSNVLFVAGGHSSLADRPKEFVGFQQPTNSVPADPVGRPSVLSIAPSVAWLFGLSEVSHYENDRLPYAFNRS